MRPTFLPILLPFLLSNLPSTVALTPCNTDDAIALPTGSGTDAQNSGSATDACSTECGNDSACLSTCLSLAGQGECAAVGCDGGSNLIDSGTYVGDDGDLIKRMRMRMRVRRLVLESGPSGLVRRQGYSCADTELCTLSGNGVLACLDGLTGMSFSLLWHADLWDGWREVHEG